MEQCKVCGKNLDIKVHDIIKRNQCSVMSQAPINKICLCSKHSRYALDVRSKLYLQKKLFKLFSKKYYHKDEIEQLLRIDGEDVDNLVRNLNWKKEGYENIEIVKTCMGGIIYAK